MHDFYTAMYQFFISLKVKKTLVFYFGKEMRNEWELTEISYFWHLNVHEYEKLPKFCGENLSDFFLPWKRVYQKSLWNKTSLNFSKNNYDFFWAVCEIFFFILLELFLSPIPAVLHTTQKARLLVCCTLWVD